MHSITNIILKEIVRYVYKVIILKLYTFRTSICECIEFDVTYTTFSKKSIDDCILIECTIKNRSISAGNYLHSIEIVTRCTIKQCCMHSPTYKYSRFIRIVSAYSTTNCTINCSIKFYTSTKIIFNEAAIKVMALQNPIGQTVRLWDQYDLEIIGIVKDFHFQSLHEPVNPAFFWLRPENTWTIMARLEAGREEEALSHLKRVYESFNPGFAFECW